jgi:hypothetical protein
MINRLQHLSWKKRKRKKRCPPALKLKAYGSVWKPMKVPILMSFSISIFRFVESFRKLNSIYERLKKKFNIYVFIHRIKELKMS